MLINFKVKTLDAQTHEFLIDNEITVREFKDEVAEKTNIAPDQQRIIYCGRVLIDDKQIKDYDLDGKVVHVAERPPPSQRAPATSTSGTQSENTLRDRTPRGNMRNSPLFRALDGMVVGTMAIPVSGASINTTGATLNPFTSSSSFCMNRITVARHMLDCANNIANYLEDPERGLNNTSLDILTRGRWTMESTVVEVGITASEIPANQNIVDMVQGAVSAALRRNGGTNVTVLQLPTVFGTSDGGETDAELLDTTGNTISDLEDNTLNTSDESAAVIIEDVIEDEDAATNASSTNAQAGSTVSNSSSSSSSGTTTATEGANNANNANNNTENRNSRRRTGTNVLAEVIDQMRNVQTRLNPFINQFYDLLRNDPTFEENDTTDRQNAQRLYDRVSEALHYMSHAQHAISDLMLDVSQPAPRYLTCRPILVEQSGYMSSNNYISAAAAASRQQQTAQAARAQREPRPVVSIEPDNSSATANSTTTNVGNATPAVEITELESSALTANAASSSDDANNVVIEDPIDEPVSPPANQVPNENHREQMARILQAVVDSTPASSDYHLQLSAPDLVTIGVPVNGNTRNNTGRTQQRNGANAAANNDNSNNENARAAMNDTAANAVNIERGATPAARSSSAANPTPNLLRVNTVTLPTTSTQTRSTSRPQIQIGTMPTGNWNGRFMPANVISSFDRFLPCNSHHIRESESNVNANTNGANAAQNTTNNNSVVPTNGVTTSTVGGSSRSTTAAVRPPSESFMFLRQLISQYRQPTINITNESTQPLPGTDAYIRNLRTQFVNFMKEKIFQNGPINESTIPMAVNRALSWFGTTLLCILPQYEKPEYNSLDSVMNIARVSLQLFIELFNEAPDSLQQFEQRLKTLCDQFLVRLYSVLVVCIGRPNTQLFWTEMMSSLSPTVRSTFRCEALNFLLIYINRTVPDNTDAADAEQFIVQRPTAMEIDDVPATVTFNNNNTASDRPAETAAIALSNVIVGSAPWHRHFPTSWLPVIERDIQAAAGEPAQPPLSDAYISGMSVKRRKMIQNSKPPADLNGLIADGVRKAIQTAGVSSSTAANVSQTPEEITKAIASDPTVQASYTELLRTNVRERLKNDPDYNPEKFPLSKAYFDNK